MNDLPSVHLMVLLKSGNEQAVREFALEMADYVGTKSGVEDLAALAIGESSYPESELTPSRAVLIERARRSVDWLFHTPDPLNVAQSGHFLFGLATQAHRHRLEEMFPTDAGGDVPGSQS